ncbi:mannosyltransferase family protein [Crocosphaera sp. UHCC 0190]|uniref:mannosyltransferase family protein n=1 Tax=Crocosphaera sp. UHCC 0190 TaxID=3110246 RepID=UPI002B1F9B1C|nr:mannosyltransferase family protein [Crocosphaera sp. UHCC 0190]MEA5510847.1 mannosyltransferase family protein [Crocosphaera sp. UHCC 0190]
MRDFWPKIYQKEAGFILAMGLLSRGVIAIAMLGIAPLLTAPSGGIQAELGWDVFSAWDSDLYQQIAVNNYDGLGENPGANVAFFPLFPLLIRGGMLLGFSSNVVGTLINNAAFLATLFVLYDWVKKTNGLVAARWATAILAWCPLSIFGTVVYSEGLFLFFSTSALSAFERQHYRQTALWGILATATRITGLALMPALMITAWHKRLPLMAYVASFASGGGTLLFSLYCWLQFRDPLAFITVQHSQWQRKQGIDWEGWSKMLGEITIGSKNLAAGAINDPWHPLLFGLIIAIAYGLWRYRADRPQAYLDYSLGVLGLFLWLLIGDPLLNTLSVLGGIVLLWCLRHQLSFLVVIYGFCALGLLISSGGTISLNRLAYGIISLTIALGLLLSRSPRLGYVTLGFFGLLLISFSIRFAQHQWVAMI